MTMIKKTIIDGAKKSAMAAVASFFSLTAFATSSGGDLIGPLNTGNTASPISDPSGFGTVLKKAVSWTYTTFFIVAVLFFLVAAYNFILGGSNEERVKTAKNQLKWGVVAIVVALLSVGVSYAIDAFLRTGA